MGTVRGFGSKQSERPFQLSFIGRGKGEKLDPNSVRTGPTYDGALNEDRSRASGKNELEVHLHARKCRKGALDSAAFAGKIQGPADCMTAITVGECAGKGCVKSGVLPNNHGPAPGWV